MRIKRLQLAGFKSCMDRTTLEFPRGITGIIGPNGCGKSNIVDALRWVLGEQSARQLRGQTMEDVIFAGNERHPPLGAAEVTIVFDNEERLSHLDMDAEDDEPLIARTLRDVPEIEVTRRLYRSGESEYLINGRSCRLRDITELFLGTGVGTKAYSIIEQGRVGQIVGAKPEELRLFIEEAAGTTLYRSRKLAAERKIERTRDNLLRVSDIVQELERQAASLRRQAKGAERWRQLKAEEEVLDKRLGSYRLTLLAKELDRVREQLDAVRDEETQVASHVQSALRERDRLRAQQRDSAAAVEAAQRASYEARARVNEVEQERRHIESRAQELERLSKEAIHEIESLDRRRRTVGDEQRALDREKQALTAELESLSERRSVGERQLAELEARAFDVAAAIERVKSGLVDTLAREAALNNECATIGRTRETLVARSSRLGEEQQSLSTVIERLTQEIEGCRARLDGLAASLSQAAGGKESASARLSSLLSKKAEAEGRVERGRQDLAMLLSRYRSLKELSENFEGYGDGVRNFMSNGGRERTGALGVVAELIDIEDGYERAVAAVLEDRLQYVVVPDPDAGVRGAHYLRETGTGRASFIPTTPRTLPLAAPSDAPEGYSLLLDHVRARPGCEHLVRSLLDGVVVADTLEAATEQWKRNGTYVTFVTPEGDVLDRAGVITGGSGRPLDEGLLSRKNELRTLQASIAEAKSNLAEAEEELRALRSACEEASRELEKLDRTLHTLTVDRVGAEGELALCTQNLTRSEERVRALSTELEQLRAEQRDADVRFGEIRDELARLQEVRTRAEDERIALEEQLAQCEEDRRRAASELEGLRVREAEARQRREHLESRIQNARAVLADVESRVQMLSARLDHDRREAEATRRRLVAPELDVEQAQAAAARAEAVAERLQSETRAHDSALAAVQQRLEQLGDRRDELREQRSQLELERKQYELEKAAVEEGLRERLGVDPNELVGDGGGNVEAEEDPDALQSELDRVRNALRRLGTVNVGAVAELEELEHRLAEMTAQRDDLERSIDDLKGTIARLNRLSKQRFKETFDAVNAIFQETFPKLFQGGKAWLALTDETNLLETGVQVFIRPPGKRVGNLELLSGGEKALTAVSLIFSLFLYKPSPFCILDEVDAPLDDANIGRFARMVTEMCDRSQFVLITHNRKTMESCDVLYGVTMREPGVSKVVAVELS